MEQFRDRVGRVMTQVRDSRSGLSNRTKGNPDSRFVQFPADRRKGCYGAAGSSTDITLQVFILLFEGHLQNSNRFLIIFVSILFFELQNLTPQTKPWLDFNNAIRLSLP